MGEIIADILAKTLVTLIKLGIVGGLLMLRIRLSSSSMLDKWIVTHLDWKSAIPIQILWGFIGMIIGNIIAYCLGYVPVTTLQKMVVAFLGGSLVI